MTSRAERPYKSAPTSDKRIPDMSGTYKVTAGTDLASQRTWELPKALVARHSDLIASLLQDSPDMDGIDLPEVKPAVFADFVDYMRSSIYSLNTQVAGYRAIRSNTDACLLGVLLKAKKYSDAALIQLHNLFEPVASYRRSRAKLSLIRASDVEYVCIKTADDSTTAATKSHSAAALRELFFDALAAHWTSREILSIGAPALEIPGDTTTWTHVYSEYHDFRVWIVSSAHTPDKERWSYLRPQAEYIDPPPSYAEVKKEDGYASDETVKNEENIGDDLCKFKMEEGDNQGGEEIKKEEGEIRTPRLKLRLKMPNLRRSNSHDRGKSPSEQDLRRVKQENEAAAGSEEAIDDMEADEMDIGMDAGIVDELD
jgi:hypothetical protein